MSLEGKQAATNVKTGKPSDGAVRLGAGGLNGAKMQELALASH